MTILGKNIFHQHGPYVEFAVLDEPPDTEEWQGLSKAAYEKGIFFELSDSLLSVYCDITRSYAPFDPDGLAFLANQQQIYEFMARLLMWQLQIANAPVFHFRKLLRAHESELQFDKVEATPDKIKADLLETLHFIIGRLHHAAASGKCVVIAGF